MMNLFQRYIESFIFRILHPSHWVRLHKTSWGWDERLRKAMDEGKKIEPNSEYTVFFDGVKVWIGNYPYGFGTPIIDTVVGCLNLGMPAPDTVARFKKYLDDISNWEGY